MITLRLLLLGLSAHISTVAAIDKLIFFSETGYKGVQTNGSMELDVCHELPAGSKSIRKFDVPNGPPIPCTIFRGDNKDCKTIEEDLRQTVMSDIADLGVDLGDDWYGANNYRCPKLG